MKTPGFVVMLCLVAFAISPDKLNAEQPAGYSAKLISPTLGQVLYAGQQVRVEWKSMLPNVRYVAWCEMEVWLSLDGGRTFPMCITPILDPKATHLIGLFLTCRPMQRFWTFASDATGGTRKATVPSLRRLL